MIAYLLLVHQYPNQFKKLFQAIHHADNVYLIHVDKKTDESVFNEIEAFLSDYGNAHLLERKVTNRGGYSLVDAELRGIETLLKLSMKWQYFINLSGQDLPLQSQQAIYTFLKAHPHTDFMGLTDQRALRPDTLHRIEHYVFETGANITSVGPTRQHSYLSDVTPYIGSKWMILSRKFCDFVVRHPDVDRFKTFYKNTFMADEGFFQTVLMNTSYRQEAVVEDDLREIEWLPAEGDAPPRPRILGLADEAMLAQSERLFARKFDETIDADIIEQLSQRMIQANKLPQQA
ncbi:MAG: hypothetical protein KBC57_13835 [Neisseriaceae bacterium]|nr:hypothetical protein [Neisseriaceae bacterium]MBP6863423.1 hypothetical protein [Neisseriaceae bacterium]